MTPAKQCITGVNDTGEACITGVDDDGGAMSHVPIIRKKMKTNFAGVTDTGFAFFTGDQ
jgi:hypothetical protein